MSETKVTIPQSFEAVSEFISKISDYLLEKSPTADVEALTQLIICLADPGAREDWIEIIKRKKLHNDKNIKDTVFDGNLSLYILIDFCQDLQERYNFNFSKEIIFLKSLLNSPQNHQAEWGIWERTLSKFLKSKNIYFEW